MWKHACLFEEFRKEIDVFELQIYIRRQVNNHPLADKLSASTIKKIADDTALRGNVISKKKVKNWQK